MSTLALVEPRGRASALLALGAVAACAVAILYGLTFQAPEVAIAVPLLAATAFAFYKLPLRASVLGVLFLTLACEGMQYALGPAEGWRVPGLSGLANALFENVSTLTGISPLRAPVLDVLTLVLFVVSLLRSEKDGWSTSLPTVRAVHMVLWASAACAAALLAIGVAQGGSFDDGLWQARQTLLFPVRAVLLMRALDGTESELKLVGRVLIAAALLKAVIGLYVLYVFAPSTGLEPEFTTSHTDTLLFVPVLAMFLARALEAKRPRDWLAGLPWAALVAWGLIANDRRVSYVSLCIGAVVMVVLAHDTPMKRVVGRGLMLVAPLLPFYLIAGWTTEGHGFFAPVGILKSLVVGEHRFGQQVDYRDLENLDVLHTWSQHRLLPLGFGHKLDLLFPLPDISAWFEAWQYHPHNSYLWFLSAGGPLGFTVMMLPQVVTLYLAARAYRATKDVAVRVAMLTAIATVIAFFNQAWGDMGTRSWSVSWMAALACALAAKLAMRTGAWPAVMRVRRE